MQIFVFAARASELHIDAAKQKERVATLNSCTCVTAPRTTAFILKTFNFTLESMTCPVVTPNANTARGETLQNVNCSSAIDLLIVLPCEISLL